MVVEKRLYGVCRWRAFLWSLKGMEMFGQMKKNWMVLLVVLLVACTFPALAEDGLKVESGVLVSYSGTSDSCIVPEGVKSIGKYAFYGNRTLEEVFLPNSLESIGDGAFANCVSLETVYLSPNIKKIGESAFYNCTALEDVALPESLIKLGAEAFAYCRKLEQVSVPSNIRKLEERTFAGCSSLAEVSLPQGMTELETEAFAFCSALKMAVLPEGVTEIGDRAFWGCAGMKALSLPDSIVSVGMDCFPAQKNLYVVINENDYLEDLCEEKQINLARQEWRESDLLEIIRATGYPEKSSRDLSVIHHGLRAVDLKDDTTWHGERNGDYIEFEIKRVSAVNSLWIKEGHHESKSKYKKYGIPTKLELSFCYAGTDEFVDPVTLEIPKGYSEDFHKLTFPWRYNVSKVRMAVVKHTRGTEYSDFVVSEVRIAGVKMKHAPFDFLVENGYVDFE